MDSPNPSAPFGSPATPPSAREAVLDLYRDAIKSGISIQDVQSELKEFDAMVDEVHTLRKKEKKLRTKFYHVKRILPVVLITVGSILVANAVWPIVYFVVFVSPNLQRTNLAAPVPQEHIIAASDKVKPVDTAQAAGLATGEFVRPKAKPIILREQLDYSNLANWFSDSTAIEQSVEEEAREYYLEIPKLGIERTNIKVGGTDLNKSLIQYPGTAEPGEFGAPVIFGHSVLRQFYRPELSNPNRLKSIFSTIMTLQPGDPIYITYEGVKYTYIVGEKHEVDPEDTYILEQRHSKRSLKLITCVPEGTYLRRGVVEAYLEKVE
jgi:LPXTG-site transpeptidase (sortase) family protein